MKTRHLILVLGLVTLSALAGWLLRGTMQPAARETAGGSGERRVLYYQSPMHPWIKSPNPGKCTICGMELAPVREGDRGFDAASGLVTLDSSSITVVGVRTEPASRLPLQRSLQVSGMIDDDETRHRTITARVPGRLEKLLVNFAGAEVREGQPLAELYSPELISQQREFVEIVRGGALTASAVAPARARLARLGLGEAELDRLAAGGEPAQVFVMRSPMGGTVLSREVSEGEQVEAGARLLVIADFSTMWFLFDAYEQDLPWLRVGQELEVTTRVMPGRILKARIAFIDPNFDPMSRSTRVRVEIPNPLVGDGPAARRELPHGVFAEGRLALDAPEVLAVQRSAILDSGRGPLVYVERAAGAYEARKLTLGRLGDQHAEVLSGLKAGDKVVVNGALLIDSQAQLSYAAQGSAGKADAGKADTPAAAHAGDEAVPHTHAGQPTQAVATPVQASAGGSHAAAKPSMERLAAVGKLAAQASAALAADNVDAYRALLPGLNSSSAGLPGLPALGNTAADLKAARKAFEPWSTALADQVRPHAAHLGLHVFECSMSPVLGTGRWLQADTTIGNPFFGSEMFSCGEELE